MHAWRHFKLQIIKINVATFYQQCNLVMPTCDILCNYVGVIFGEAGSCSCKDSLCMGAENW